MELEKRDWITRGKQEGKGEPGIETKIVTEVVLTETEKFKIKRELCATVDCFEWELYFRIV